jgi:NADH-quinone oxidoreductase subunit I
MICARECPDWCITIEGHAEPVPAPQGQPPSRRPRSTTVLDRFAIDFALCMYCGICVDTCPFDALFWAPDYSYAGPGPTDLLAEKGRLVDWLADAPAAEPLDEGAEPPPVPTRRASRG